VTVFFEGLRMAEWPKLVAYIIINELQITLLCFDCPLSTFVTTAVDGTNEN
jgi:hypothetical protein